MFDKRFDVMLGVNFPQRIAHNLTQAELVALLAERRMTITTERAIGLILHEVQVRKV